MVEIQSYEPLEKIKAFHSSKAKFRCLFGGYGAGKTVAGIWDDIDDLEFYPGLTIFCGRKYREDVKIDGSIFDTFYRQCPPELIQETREGGWEVHINGGKVVFGGLYTRQRARLKIPICGKFHIDESSEINEDDLRLLQGRLRQTDDENGKKINVPLSGIFTTNPPNNDHWKYKKFVLDKNPDYELFKVSIFDNPHLAPDYVNNLVNEYKDNPSWYKRYVLGDFGFIAYGHPVYSGFSENFHVADLAYNQYLPILRGWDFGWHHPCLTFAQMTEDDRFVILDSVMGDKEYLDTFADRMIKYSNTKYPGCKFDDYCDIAGLHKADTSPMTSIQTLQSKGIEPKYMRALVMDGVQKLQKGITKLVGEKPGIMVNRSNKLAVDMFLGGYYFAKLQDGQYEPDPCKDGYYEHVADTIRYIYQFIYHTTQHEKKIKVKEASFRSLMASQGLGHIASSGGKYYH